MSAEPLAASDLPRAGVWRRMGAMLYDLLLVLALMFVLTALFLPFTDGEGIRATQMPLLAALYNLARVALIVGFFGLFWTRQGQTLGMMAWRLKVMKADGSRLTWSDTLKRLGAAVLSWLPAGLGYFWIWVNGNGLAWHDLWTGTRVVVVPKRK